MCNRFVQAGRIVKPGERARVLMKGPGAVFELPFDEAVFGRPAKSESRNYWIRREGAEPVIVPDVERFGEKNNATGEQLKALSLELSPDHSPTRFLSVRNSDELR
jgi:hypothetical protein